MTSHASVTQNILQALTVDLSSFNLELEGGNQYVMGLIQDNADNFITGGGIFRVSASRATGFEDVFRSFSTPSNLRPGYVKSQLGNSFEQYADAFSMAPLLPGDYDYDGDVDGDDYTKWRENFGSTSNLMADGNDDATVNAADYVVWRNNLGATATAAPPDSSTVVPEPGSLMLVLLGSLMFASGRRRLSFRFPHP